MFGLFDTNGKALYLITEVTQRHKKLLNLAHEFIRGRLITQNLNLFNGFIEFTFFLFNRIFIKMRFA